MNARLGVISLLVAVGSLGSAQAAEGDAEPPFVHIVGEEGVIPVERAVGDVLVVDGRVEIRGVVRGHVYAVASEVAVRSTAVVLKSITLTRGALELSEGAVLPPRVDLVGAALAGPRGELGAGEERVVNGGATRVVRAETEPSTVAVTLMRSVLAFDRFTPTADADVRDLRSWHPGLGLGVKRFVEGPERLVVGGITRLSFVSDKVEGAFQRGYRGPRGSVLLTGVRLKSPDSARALWQEIEAAESQVKVQLSVKSGLGDGAHWFFRRRGRYVMLWQHGPWFMSVETRLLGEDVPALQQKQFLDQVLASLKAGLEPPAAPLEE